MTRFGADIRAILADYRRRSILTGYKYDKSSIILSNRIIIELQYKSYRLWYANNYIEYNIQYNHYSYDTPIGKILMFATSNIFVLTYENYDIRVELLDANDTYSIYISETIDYYIECYISYNKYNNNGMTRIFARLRNRIQYLREKGKNIHGCYTYV